MGYKGGGLDINGQWVTQPLEVVQRPPFAGLGYGKVEIGECSKIAKARATSTSLDSNRGSKAASPHHICNKDKPGRYKSHSNSFLEFNKNDFCITYSNHDVAKHQTQKFWVKNIDESTRIETNQKPHLPSHLVRNAQLNGKRRNFCSYCNISGHREKRGWKIHPQLHCDSRKKPTPTPTKKGAMKELVINVPTPISEGM